MIPEQTLLSYPVFGDNATKVEPDNNKKSNGWQQGDVVPAEWMNWGWYHNSKGITDLNRGVSSMEKELINVLTEYNIVPAEATENQLKTVFEKIHPQFADCETAAATAGKTIAITGNVLKTGNIYIITMTYGNTAANPTLSINSGTAYQIVDQTGQNVLANAWTAGDTIILIYTGSSFVMISNPVNAIENGSRSPVTGNAVSCVITANKTLTGPRLGNGGKIKVLFTSNITGSNSTDVLTLTYNGTDIPVKVNKYGTLSNYTAKFYNNYYYYAQANTVFDLIYKTSEAAFIIEGNPLVFANSDVAYFANDTKIQNFIDNTENVVMSKTIKYAFGWMKFRNQTVLSGGQKLVSTNTKSYEFIFFSHNRNISITGIHLEGDTTTLSIPATNTATLSNSAITCYDTSIVYFSEGRADTFDIYIKPYAEGL